MKRSHASRLAAWRIYESSSDSDDEDVLIFQRSDEESSLFQFYAFLVKVINSRCGTSRFLIKGELRGMIDNYKKTKNGRTPRIQDFNLIPSCLVYLHRYAYCHTIMVRKAVLELMNASAQVREKLDRGILNAVFLGSGPANDLVGFLSALYGRHRRIRKINATCVDKYIYWFRILEETLQYLRREPLFGNCNRLLQDIDVETKYKIADLTDQSTWREDLSDYLRKADVVFLVKFLSHVPDEEKLITLQNIVKSMQTGALLVYIDCPFDPYLFEDSSLNLRFVYGQNKKVYTVENSRRMFGFNSIKRSTAFVIVYEKQETPLLESVWRMAESVINFFDRIFKSL